MNEERIKSLVKDLRVQAANLNAKSLSGNEGDILLSAANMIDYLYGAISIETKQKLKRIEELKLQIIANNPCGTMIPVDPPCEDKFPPAKKKGECVPSNPFLPAVDPTWTGTEDMKKQLEELKSQIESVLKKVS